MVVLNTLWRLRKNVKKERFQTPHRASRLLREGDSLQKSIAKHQSACCCLDSSFSPDSENQIDFALFFSFHTVWPRLDLQTFNSPILNASVLMETGTKYSEENGFRWGAVNCVAMSWTGFHSSCRKSVWLWQSDHVRLISVCTLCMHARTQWLKHIDSTSTRSMSVTVSQGLWQCRSC